MKDKGYVLGMCASIIFYACIIGAMFYCTKSIDKGESPKKTNNTNKVTQHKHIERDIVSFNIPKILNANDSNIVKFMLDDGWELLHEYDSLAYGEICGRISDGHKYGFRKEESVYDIDIIEYNNSIIELTIHLDLDYKDRNIKDYIDKIILENDIKMNFFNKESNNYEERFSDYKYQINTKEYVYETYTAFTIENTNINKYNMYIVENVECSEDEGYCFFDVNRYISFVTKEIEYYNY